MGKDMAAQNAPKSGANAPQQLMARIVAMKIRACKEALRSAGKGRGKLAIAAILALGLAVPAIAEEKTTLRASDLLHRDEFGTAADMAAARQMLTTDYETISTLRILAISLDARVKILDHDVDQLQGTVDELEHGTNRLKSDPVKADQILEVHRARPSHRHRHTEIAARFHQSHAGRKMARRNKR